MHSWRHNAKDSLRQSGILLRSAAQEIAFAYFYPVVPQDRVRGCVMEVEIGHDEIQEVIVSGEFQLTTWKLEFDRAILSSKEIIRLEGIQERLCLGDTCM